MNFIKKILIYCVGTLFSKIVIFILLPIYTNRFSPSDYGNVDLAITTVTMIVSFAFIELWTPLLRYSLDDNSKKNRSVVFSNIMAISAVCLPIFIVLTTTISVWQNIPHIALTLLYGISIYLMNIFQFSLRASGDTTGFLVSGIVSTMLQLVISLVLIYPFNWDSSVILIAPIISNLIAVLYIQIRSNYAENFKLKLVSKKMVMNIVKYSFPLALNAVAYWGMTNINRYFARYYLSNEANGYIAVATKFTSLVMTLVQIYSLAWQESVYAHANSEDREKYYSKMLNIYMTIMFIGTSIIIIFTKLIFPYFINEEYSNTLNILPLYYLATLISSFSVFYGHIFNGEKKTAKLLQSTVFGAITNISLLFLTINWLGIYSIPFALSFGNLVNVIVRVRNLSNFITLKIEKNILLINTVLLVASIIISYIEIHILGYLLFILLCLTVFILILRADISANMRAMINKITKKPYQ